MTVWPKETNEFFEHKRFTGDKIIEWLPSNPDFNSIENPWSVAKVKLYEDGK